MYGYVKKVTETQMSESIWSQLLDILQNRTDLPNTFTRYLGQQLKQAREESGLSQSELANIVHKRRPSISDFENGKMMPDIGTMVLFAAVLKKPLTYFVAPIYLRGQDKIENSSDLEQELLITFNELSHSEQLLALKLIRSLADHIHE